MCGIVGIVNHKKNISTSIELLKRMTNKIKKRGPDCEGFFIEQNILLGHRRLSIIDVSNGAQPMSVKYNNVTYTIVYNGELYNTLELKKDLIKHGMSFITTSDTEVLIKGYIIYGKHILNRINGIYAFAIWNSSTYELFMARDHIGIKPLYYTTTNSNFIFASEIKSILEHNEVESVLDKQGIQELIGIGPAHTPGTTIFQNIHELRGGHYLIYNKQGLFIDKYWQLKSKKNTDSFDTIYNNVKFLVKDSIERQLVSDVPLGTMLSGGLDSSIISHYASKHLKNNNLGKLHTFSITYKDNDKNFVKNDFQPNSDDYYVDVMVKALNSNHKTITLDTEDLANYLRDAVIARDLPGMADIDSSILLFCKEIKKDVKVVLSGECADEIFGGYPWFFRDDALKSNTFPWSIAVEERQKLLNPEVFYNLDLKQYIDKRYNESLNEIDYINTRDEDKKDIFHLNYYWFMQNLLDRSDKMSMYSGLEVRVPFGDYRILEYLWNIPWNIKSMNGREKGLLREIATEILPNEIVNRKKSPYPKTHNPSYLKRVKEILTDILNDPHSPIKNILNPIYLEEILETEGKAFTRPWFGQLMTGPQLMAYLIQLNDWLEIYKPRIEL